MSRTNASKSAQSSNSRRDTLSIQSEQSLVNRRHLLGGLAAGVTLFAGCNALNGQGETNQTTNNTTTMANTTVRANATDFASPETNGADTEATGTSQGRPISTTDALYASMIPVPEDSAEFNFDFYRLGALRNRQRESTDFLPGSTDESATYPGIGGFEIPYTEIDTLLLADWDVVVGPFDKNSIIRTLREDSDADLREEYKGYEIYVESDDASANAIAGNTLVSGLFPEPSLTGVKATIDVLEGDGERFYDTNKDFQALVDALGSGLVVTGQLAPDVETQNVRNDAGYGLKIAAENDVPVFSITVLFENAAAADPEAVRELFVDDPEFGTYFASPENVSVEQSGRVVTLTGEYSPEQTATSLTTTPTATTTPSSTATTTMSSGELVLSPRSGYTNDTYSYRIDYPQVWNVDESLPQQVEIANLDGDGIRISVFDEQYSSSTLEEVVDESLANSRQSATTLEVSDRREMTLESGQSAIVLNVTYDVSTDTASNLRSYLLLAKQGETVYQVEFVADAPDWTATVEREAMTLIESFVIMDGSTTTDKIQTIPYFD